MKKLLILMLSLLLIGTLVVGCTADEGDTSETSAPAEEPADETDADSGASYEDGVYFAQADEFADSGYKYFVVLTIEDGKITDATWDGTNIQPMGSKVAFSESGEYGMENIAEAGAWHEQAAGAEQWLIENQDPTAITYTSDEGYTDDLETDAGASVSVNVSDFFELAEKALEAGPVEEGEYATPDNYIATAKIPADTNAEDYDPTNAWDFELDLIVVNGTIVDSHYNATFAGEFSDETAKFFKEDRDGNLDENAPISKVELGEDYGMDWKGNAENIDAYVVENQGFDVDYTDDEGHTDSISGVSIHVNEYEELFKDALGL